MKIPLEMYEEVVVGRGALPDWLKVHRAVMVLDESVDTDLIRAVTEAGYAGDLTDEEIEKLGRDPFLIAYALADFGQRCVVTTETPRLRQQRANRKVPDVCDRFKYRTATPSSSSGLSTSAPPTPTDHTPISPGGNR